MMKDGQMSANEKSASFCETKEYVLALTSLAIIPSKNRETDSMRAVGVCKDTRKGT